MYIYQAGHRKGMCIVIGSGEGGDLVFAEVR